MFQVVYKEAEKNPRLALGRLAFPPPRAAPGPSSTTESKCEQQAGGSLFLLFFFFMRDCHLFRWNSDLSFF